MVRARSSARLERQKSDAEAHRPGGVTCWSRVRIPPGPPNDKEPNKCILVDATARFHSFKQIPFQRAVCQKIVPLAFIQLEREVNDLFSGTTKKVGPFLVSLKETGMRPSEASALGWSDIDFERRCLSCTPERNSNPEQLKISNQLISMINLLEKQGKWIFHSEEVDSLYSLVVVPTSHYAMDWKHVSSRESTKQ
jgi:hypothetical protein